LPSAAKDQGLQQGNPNKLITAFPLIVIPDFLLPLAVLLHLALWRNWAGDGARRMNL
jgi:hypothetical protein